MTVLILGVALWWGAHFFKRLAPERRAAMGEKGKGLVTLLLVASVVLMVWGYRSAEFVPVWEPPAFLVHVNNLLMLLAFYLYAASGMKTAILKATDQRTRSVRTAKMSPTAVTAAGTISTHSALFLSAVRRRSIAAVLAASRTASRPTTAS